MSEAWRYGLDDLDPECVALCDALNRLPGVRTTESCCGHGEAPFWIWFMVRRLRDLPRPVYWFASCHCGCRGWRVVASTDCAMSPVLFMVAGPVGAEGYAQASKIAKLIAGSLP